MTKNKPSSMIEDWLDNSPGESPFGPSDMEDNGEIFETDSQQDGILLFDDTTEGHYDINIEDIMARVELMRMRELMFNYELLKDLSWVNDEMIYMSEQASEKQDRMSEDIMTEHEAVQDERTEWTKKIKTAQRRHTNFEDEANKLVNQQRHNTFESEIIDQFHENIKPEFRMITDEIQALRERRQLFSAATAANIEKLKAETSVLTDENAKNSDVLAALRKELNNIKIDMMGDEDSGCEDDSSDDLSSDITDKGVDEYNEYPPVVKGNVINFNIHPRPENQDLLERSISPDTDMALKSTEKKVDSDIVADDDELELAFTEASSPEENALCEDERPTHTPGLRGLLPIIVSPELCHTPKFGKEKIKRGPEVGASDLSCSVNTSIEETASPTYASHIADDLIGTKGHVFNDGTCIVNAKSSPATSQSVTEVPKPVVKTTGRSSKCEDRCEYNKNKPRKLIHTKYNSREDSPIAPSPIAPVKAKSVSHIAIEINNEIEKGSNEHGLEKKTALNDNIETSRYGNDKPTKASIKDGTGSSYEGLILGSQSATKLPLIASNEGLTLGRKSPKKLPPIASNEGLTLGRQSPTKLPPIASNEGLTLGTQSPTKLPPIASNEGLTLGRLSPTKLPPIAFNEELTLGRESPTKLPPIESNIQTGKHLPGQTKLPPISPRQGKKLPAITNSQEKLPPVFSSQTKAAPNQEKRSLMGKQIPEITSLKAREPFRPQTAKLDKVMNTDIVSKEHMKLPRKRCKSSKKLSIGEIKVNTTGNKAVANKPESITRGHSDTKNTCTSPQIKSLPPIKVSGINPRKCGPVKKVFSNELLPAINPKKQTEKRKTQCANKPATAAKSNSNGQTIEKTEGQVNVVGKMKLLVKRKKYH